MNAFAYTVTARGFNSPESSNKLAVYIDGRSVYSPLASTTFWENIDLPLADIERIEVVSGPGGTLYGANAVNGVISIVTKKAADTKGGLVDASGGTNDDKFMLRYGFSPWNGADLRLYGRLARTNHTTPVLATDLTRTAWLQDEFGFRFDQTLDGDNLFLEGDLYNNRTPQQKLEKGRGGSLTGHWDHQFDSGSALETQISYDKATRTLPGIAREVLETYDIQAQHNTSLGWNDTFVWGGEYRHWSEGFFTPGPFNFIDPTTDIALGSVFAQDEFPLSPALKLTLGVKAEHNSYSGFDAMPNIRLAWQASDTALIWGAVSRAVRTPSKVDRELEAPGILLPAPDFGSETMTAYELGYRGEPLSRVSLSASLYYQDYDGLRSDQGTPVTVFPVTLVNGAAGGAYGLEVWGKYTLSDGWRLSAVFNWLLREFHAKPGYTDLALGQSEGQDPPYQAQLRSEMNLFGNIELDAGLRAIGAVTQKNLVGGEARLVKSYVEGDARIAWRVTPSTVISVSGFNLLHDRHVEANDPSTFAPQFVPRTVLLNVRQSF
jgi:iron complex outermembrane receptor protein